MALSEIQVLFRRCLYRRLSALEFRDVVKQYRRNRKFKSRDVVSNFINCCLNFCVEGDPLLHGYLQELLLSQSASFLDFITALIFQWKSLTDSEPQQQQLLAKVISMQRQLVTDLNIILATNPSLKIDELRKCIVLSARWLEALIKSALGNHTKDNVNTHNLTEVVGVLLVSLLNLNTSTRAPDIYTAVQQALDQCMNAFPSISMELMNKLSTIQKPNQEDSSDTVDPHVMEMAAIQFEEGVMHAQIVATRSATVALLQDLLSKGSTIDDSVIYSFLNTRHAGSHAVMFNDLVFASVDAMIKPPSNDLYTHQCELFLYNKLPSILSIIVTSSFESFSSEQSLVDAWNYVNTASPDSAQSIRRFLQICAIFHLIPHESTTALVGEDTTLKGLYAKDELVSQVTANHTRGPRLIDELLKNDGNAGSISQAVVEIMHNYCLMRETQHLKDMANAIVRRPAAINAIGMFTKPALFLSPLCTLLDEWKWDDIHGESQPMYDEFGSVFLLIIAFKHRLRVGDYELGIQQDKGFLARYLSDMNHEQLNMTEVTDKYVGDWIKALYIDEGLSDELTSSCSAQEFYMLVPTLLAQSCYAYRKGKLSHDLLKAGLEYLLEPFLLPSLIPAFGWLERIIHTDPQTAELVMQILTKPPGGEAKEIHQTILAIAAERLHTDNLPKHQPFSLTPSEGDLTQISNETYTSLTTFTHTHNPLTVITMLITLLLQQPDFHTSLDFIATTILTNDYSLRSAVQILHARLPIYLKTGENLLAEAIVHLYRRVELYASTLASQELGAGGAAGGVGVTMEPFVPLNVANVDLDAAVAAAAAAGVGIGVGGSTDGAFNANDMGGVSGGVGGEDIDQVLNEAAALGMDGLDSANLDDMYGLQSGDFGLGSLDDLDLDMF